MKVLSINLEDLHRPFSGICLYTTRFLVQAWIQVVPRDPAIGDSVSRRKILQDEGMDRPGHLLFSNLAKVAYVELNNTRGTASKINQDFAS